MRVMAALCAIRAHISVARATACDGVPVLLGGFGGDLRLRDCGEGRSSILKVQLNVLPPLQPDAPPVFELGGRLKVIIQSATGLRAADVGGSSDPFCECQLMGKPDTLIKTKHISRTLAPQWNEEHEFPVYESGDSIEFKAPLSIRWIAQDSATLAGRFCILRVLQLTLFQTLLMFLLKKKCFSIIYICMYIYIYILIFRRRRPNPVDGYLFFVSSNIILNHLLFLQMLVDLGRSFTLF